MNDPDSMTTASFSMPSQTDRQALSGHLDLLETKAANASGITAWADDTALAYETAVIPHRR